MINVIKLREGLNDILSNRELEVVIELTKGGTNKEIANALFISEKTVKFHMTRIFKLMGIDNRVKLLVYLHEEYKNN